ncbi:hypothetical protein SynA18461_00565 [Synechococcus sp. A18-46.1]|nr:hypothetical protein SynA18461_00565 [Synechococcus sp. A18-46.1]
MVIVMETSFSKTSFSLVCQMQLLSGKCLWSSTVIFAKSKYLYFLIEKNELFGCLLSIGLI